MKITKIILGVLVVLIIWYGFASAETTFFDDENDMFIMGTAGIFSGADKVSDSYPTDGGGSSIFCLEGHKFYRGICINVNDSILNFSGKTNKSTFNNSQLEPEEATIEEPRAVGEPELVIEKPGAVPIKRGIKKIWHSLLVGGVLLFVVASILLLWRRKS